MVKAHALHRRQAQASRDTGRRNPRRPAIQPQQDQRGIMNQPANLSLSAVYGTQQGAPLPGRVQNPHPAWLWFSSETLARSRPLMEPRCSRTERTAFLLVSGQECQIKRRPPGHDSEHETGMCRTNPSSPRAARLDIGMEISEWAFELKAGLVVRLISSE
jgi:hypothetical protein